MDGSKHFGIVKHRTILILDHLVICGVIFHFKVHKTLTKTHLLKTTTTKVS